VNYFNELDDFALLEIFLGPLLFTKRVSLPAVRSEGGRLSRRNEDMKEGVNADELLTLSHATERDVDLLLVEELATSNDFAQWIATTAGWNHAVSKWRVAHSKRRTSNRREIDIELRVEGGGDVGQAILLIENKLF